MKNVMISLAAAAALVFSTGCGGDACDDLEDAGNALEDKIEACSDGGSGGSTDFDSEACKEALDECSDSDKDKLSAYADCLSDLPDCEQGEETEWANELLGCTEEIEGLSAACAAAGGE